MEFGIGKRIKEARLNKGLTQEMLALMVGVTKGAIANYENGTSHPKEPVMYALIDALGVDANFLFQDCVKIKKAPLYSSEAMRLARDYDSLDIHGQRVVRMLAAEEKSRCTAETAQRGPAFEVADPEKVIRFSVPGYRLPMSAGTGQEAGEEYPENYTLVKEPPRGTSFIAQVSGNSMEPTYRDGDLLFVHAAEEIPPGKIGVFHMDGQQWVKELGDGILISHNTQYAPIPMREDIRCQGLVLGVCDESYFE